MPESVSVQSTGQYKGTERSQSQHVPDWADAREHSDLRIPTVSTAAHALAHALTLKPLAKLATAILDVP